MKVFISWAGPLSEQVACVLRDWLPAVIPPVQPWVSSEDIEKGARWFAQLSNELDSTSFGILCVVPGNLDSLWLTFEAGALSRSIGASRVSPLLFGVFPSDLRGPISQFQATRYEENDLRRLVLSINKSCGDQGLSQDRLDHAFRICWPGLRERLDPLFKQTKLTNSRSQAGISLSPSQTSNPQLEDIQTKILTALGEENGLTLDSLCDLFEMKSAKMRYHLEVLQAMKLIDRIESWKGEIWYELDSQGRKFLVENNLI